MTVNNTPRTGAGKKIATIILIAANLLMLTAGILTIPPNIRGAEKAEITNLSTASAPSAQPTPGVTQAQGLGEAAPDLTAPAADTQDDGPLSIANIAGTYTYVDNRNNTTQQIEVINDEGVLRITTGAGSTHRYDYDPATGVAFYSETSDVGALMENTLTFGEGPEGMRVSAISVTTLPTGHVDEFTYEGRRIDPSKPDSSISDSTAGTTGTALPLQDITGTYEYYAAADPTDLNQFEIISDGGVLTMVFAAGNRVSYEYAPASATARHTETVDGETWEHTLIFRLDAGKMLITIISKNMSLSAQGEEYIFEGYRKDAAGGGAQAAVTSAVERPKLSDFLGFLEDALVYGSPSGAVFIDDFERVKGNWKGLLFDNAEDLYDSTYVSLFNLDISGTEGSVTLTPDWYREYSSFDESSLSDRDITDTGPYKGTWAVVNGYALLDTEGEEIDGMLTLGVFYEHEQKQYAIGTLTWWDGWETYVVLIRP